METVARKAMYGWSRTQENNTKQKKKTHILRKKGRYVCYFLLYNQMGVTLGQSAL